MGSSASTQTYGNRNVVSYPKQNNPGAQSSMGFHQAQRPAMVSSNAPHGGQHGQQHHIGFAPAPGNNFAGSGPAAENENVRRTTMDKETMLRYVQIEKDINRLEAMNVVEHLQIKWDELKSLEEEIKRLTVIFQSRKDQTMKEKKDVDDLQEPSVRAFFADQSELDARMSREQEEYLAALNKQELAQKELESAEEIRESVKVAVNELHKHTQQLQNLYKEQDVLLADIFDGKYGSEMEFRLEREHDSMSDRQQRIAAAKARWQAGRLLVHHACAQLGHVVKQWESCSANMVQSMQQRYAVATETRNYLIAACANMRNSQNYLKGIEFPYCKLEEVNTMERAANNIYTDVATPERHQHAMSVYRAMFQRCGALLQWFDTVIDKTIDRDMLSATEGMFGKKRELRMERVRLIKAKLVELLGAEEAEAAGLDEDANFTDAKRLHEQLASVNKEEMEKLMKNVKVVQPEGHEAQPDAADPNPAPTQSVVADTPATGSKKRKKRRKSKRRDGGQRPETAEQEQQDHEQQNDQQDDEQQTEQTLPAPPKTENMPKIDVVSLKDLAPPPSHEQLFGDIDSIKKQYEIDMEEYQRAQDLNRARVEQGLQEKLAARKSRKARKMAQEQETEKLLLDSANA